MPFNTCGGVPKCSLCADHRRLLLRTVARSAIKVSLKIEDGEWNSRRNQP